MTMPNAVIRSSPRTPRRRSLQTIARDRLQEQRMYRDLRSWMLHLYDRALRRWRRSPLPGRGRIVKVRPSGIRNAVTLRLGGSDFPVLMDMCGPQGGEYDVVRSLRLGQSPSILDLGANIGLSVLLWRTWYPEARVLAVEPDPDNASMILRNAPDACALGEGEASVQIAQVCVAAQAGEVMLDRSELPWAFTMRREPSLESNCSAIRVPAVTMDSLLERWGATESIDLLKCNIEGAERELFEAGGRWLSRVRHFVLETHDDWGETELAAALDQAGASFRLSTLQKTGGHSRILGVAEGASATRTSPVGAA